MSFEGKIIWITGASSGIGAALARELAAQGGSIVLSARRVGTLEEVRKSCAFPERHMCYPLDVSHPDTHPRAVKAILERYGQLDILIVNAGIGQRGAVADTDMAVERSMMEVNYFGCTSLTHAVLPHFQEHNRGQIVVISSIMGHVATPRRATYAASKHALHGYFEALRAELYQTNIKISLVCPGYIHTEISIHSVTEDGTRFGEMDAQHRKAMPAATFARKAARQIRKKKAVCYIGGPERFGPLLQRISPSLVRFLLPRVITRD